jgi:hypothetical protein
MRIFLKLCFVSKVITALLFIIHGNAIASSNVSINLTTSTPLFDGRCNKEEWQSATKIELPAGTAIYLMHNQDSLFVCAKGKVDDYTVLDIYIENTLTGNLHNLHASAQLSENLFSHNQWGEPERWNLKDWGGLWVPYAGQEDYDGGKRPKFLKGTDSLLIFW